MKIHTHKNLTKNGFTLMETVIAIGVIAVLVTGFIAVFTPAIEGIRRSISMEEANRLTSTLERELVTLRGSSQQNEYATGFDKAIDWIQSSDTLSTAMIIYQYRGEIGSIRSGSSPNDDNTQVPSVVTTAGGAGTNFTTVPMLRRNNDPLLDDDLTAMEGRAYVVRCIPLIEDEQGNLIRANSSQIENADDQAVITFAAEFYSLPARDLSSLTQERFNNMSRPMFTRNLAVRR